MHKRGQVTTFVVIGLVLVVLIAVAVFFFTTSRVSQPPTTALDIKEFTRSCIDSIGREALITIGVQGGYATPPTQTLALSKNEEPYGEIQIAHWVSGNSDFSPTLAQVNQEINQYMQDHITECTNNYDAYQQQGWTIEAGTLTVETTFDTKETILSATYPITATKGAQRLEFTSIDPVRIPWDVKGIYETAITSANYYRTDGIFAASYAANRGHPLINSPAGISTLFRFVSEENNEEQRYVWIFAGRK